MICHSKLEDLNNSLQVHDWYHAYSDDHIQWQKGRRHFQHILKLSSELIVEGYIEEVKKMWKDNAPAGYEDGWKS